MRGDKSGGRWNPAVRSILRPWAQPPWLHASSPSLWASLRLLSPPNPPAGSGLLEGNPHTVSVHPGGQKWGTCPRLTPPSAPGLCSCNRRASANVGNHGVLAEGRPCPWPSVLFCSLEGEGLVLSLPVLTTGLSCVFSDRARIINSTRLLCKPARPFIAYGGGDIS